MFDFNNCSSSFKIKLFLFMPQIALLKTFLVNYFFSKILYDDK